MNNPKFGRETIYAGIPMRSRLEAGFAQQLDGFGQHWEYEGAAYASVDGQYLPDFVVHRPDGAKHFIEVKPKSVADPEAVFRRMHVILASVPDAELLLVLGAWPDDYTPWVPVCRPDHPCRFPWCQRVDPEWGLLVERYPVLDELSTTLTNEPRIATWGKVLDALRDLNDPDIYRMAVRHWASTVDLVDA